MVATGTEYLPGDVAETSYGVGVIADCPNDERPTFRVLLWRVPGKSIGSSSVAYLQPHMVRKNWVLVACRFLAMVWPNASCVNSDSGPNASCTRHDYLEERK